MNLETKEVSEKNHFEMMQFGWTIKDVIEKPAHRGRHISVFIMTRDKDSANYPKLAKLEQEYLSYKNSIRQYQPMNEVLTIVLYLAFLLPGILYTIYKTKEKSEITSRNNALRAKMAQNVEEAKKYLL